MKKTVVVVLIVFIHSFYLLSQEKATNYLNQTPPELSAKLFYGGDLVENAKNEKRSFNIAFSPDGNEMFFSYIKGTEEKPNPEYEIKTFKLINDEWIGPKTASFSGIYSDVDLNFSPDGNYIFFASDRPQPHSADYDIYYSIKTEDGWSEPIYAGTDINTVEGEVYPSVSSKGNIFFRSRRTGGFSDSDIYRAEWVNGNFINVKNLGPNVNSPYGQSNAVIAPDESFILFCTLRPGNDRWQIFISFQIGDNTWTKAVSIGSEVNTEAGSGTPTLTPDAKFLFFRKRIGSDRGNYWISMEIIEELKPKELKD